MNRSAATKNSSIDFDAGSNAGDIARLLAEGGVSNDGDVSPAAGVRRPVRRIGLFRVGFLLLASIILAAGAAAMAASRMDTVYAAEADILFNLGDRPDVLEKYLATQAVVARSRAVLDPVARNSGESIAMLEHNLTVEFPKGGAVMRLQYADKDADKAHDVLKTVVDGYVALLGRSQFLDAGAEVLVPVFVLEEPIWPKPLQAAALGGAVGLALAIGGLALVQYRRQTI